MATKIATYFTTRLIAASVIEEEDRELYCYGFFLLITGLFFFLVTAIIGFLFGLLFESIAFYGVFMILRSYSGGIHAKTETACTILTTLALIASVLGIRLLKQTNSLFVSISLLATGSLCILLLSPLDTKDKPLDSQDKKRYRMICVTLVLLCIIGASISHVLLRNMFFESIICGVFLEGLLLITGKIYS